MPLVAVIVRTFNEEAGLPALLEDLRGQTQRDFEVVVVDSGSTDRTREIALTCQDPPVRLIDLDQFSYGRALNVALASTDAPFVAFLSAHVRVLSPDWLAEMIRACRSPGVVAAFSRQVPWRESPWYERLFVRTMFSREVRLPALPSFSFTNAATMIRRDRWQVRPFDETLPACEDYEWATRQVGRGGRIVWVPHVSVRHSHDETFACFLRRRVREGRALGRILRTRLAA